MQKLAFEILVVAVAEFSRDTDFAILADAANLIRLRKALAELRAELIRGLVPVVGLEPTRLFTAPGF